MNREVALTTNNGTELRCLARVYDNRGVRGDWSDHQCRYRASTTRAVSAWVGRIPVCRIHRRQRRRDFGEWRP